MILDLKEAKEIGSVLSEYRLHVVGPDLDMPLSEFLDHATESAYAKGFDDGFQAGKGRTRRVPTKKIRQQYQETEKSSIYIILKPRQS